MSSGIKLDAWEQEGPVGRLSGQAIRTDSLRILQFAPEPVGSLIIVEGFRIATPRKPSRFHLWAMKFAFGWRWEDL